MPLCGRRLGSSEFTKRSSSSVSSSFDQKNLLNRPLVSTLNAVYIFQFFWLSYHTNVNCTFIVMTEEDRKSPASLKVVFLTTSSHEVSLRRLPLSLPVENMKACFCKAPLQRCLVKSTLEKKDFLIL